STLVFINNINSINNEGVILIECHIQFDGNTSILGNGIYQFNLLSINTNKTLEQISPTINIHGSISNFGTFIPNTNTVIFNGSLGGSIQSNNNLSFYNLVIDIGALGNFLLFSPITIDGNLQLNNGILSNFGANNY